MVGMASPKAIIMIAGQIEKISSDQFVERIVVNKVDALVKISSAWNGASQMVSRTLQGLAPQYTEVGFFSVDYEPESALSLTYRIETEPTILFFKKGTLVDKISGLAHRTIITHKIHQLINS
jgi:thioredoxin-like negative regulator of GroEL